MEKQAKYPTVVHKVFETNSSFYMKLRTTGKVYNFCFSRVFDSFNKIFILARRLGTWLSFYEILRFF